MDFQTDLRGWPNSSWSRQVKCAPHLWHVQEAGTGPTVLFLHGAGASTHSWAAVMQDMVHDHHVVTLDLPGHGFTRLGNRRRSGLQHMTQDIAALCKQEGWSPKQVIAHSAGGAIALLLCHRHLAPLTPTILAVNPALAEFDGVARTLFPMVAKGLSINPLVPLLVSWGPNAKGRASRLIRSTGSDLSPEQLECYAKLLQDRDHIQGALLMMAQWSFSELKATLPILENRCTFVIGPRDKAVSPIQVEQACTKMRNCRTVTLPDLGHLAHEEAPERVARLIRQDLQGLEPDGLRTCSND